MADPENTEHATLTLPNWAVWALWAVLIGCLIAEAIHRLWGGYVPRDLSAYLAAADTFIAGGDPYTDDIKQSAVYQGYVFVYPPGTLPLLGGLDYLSARVVATLDLFARSAVLLASLAWLRRRFAISAPLCALALIALLFEPVLVDFRAGNLPTYLFGAFLAAVHMTENPREIWYAPAAVAVGAALAFKPMWLAPAALLVLVRRRWLVLAGMIVGASLIGALTLVHLDMVPTWLERIEQLAIRYRNAVLVNIHPLALAAGVVAWVAGGVALLRRRGLDDAWFWLWLCVSVVVWLRAGTYTYVLFLPVFFFWWRRWGLRKAALAFVVTLGPLPWMLRAFGMFAEYGWMQLAWGIAVAGALFWQLMRDGADSPTRRQAASPA